MAEEFFKFLKMNVSGWARQGGCSPCGFFE
jgi:hypothetical protein